MEKPILAVLFAAVLSGPALAYSDAQMAVMSHVGQAVAGAKICSRTEVSEGAMALMLAAYDIELDDPAIAEIIRSKVSENVEAWSGKGEDLACAAVLMLYGPKGSNVPGLLRVKD